MSNPIGWCDTTWNVVTGCTPVSEACEHCYARRMATRLRGRYGYPADEPFRVTLHPERLKEPQRWKKPQRVFPCSMSDLFHPDVPDWFIADVLGAMARADWHLYQILTKRVDRMRATLSWLARNSEGSDVLLWPRPRVGVGATVENQDRLDERYEDLRATPAAFRFLSIEPMLGPITFRPKARSQREMIELTLSGDGARPLLLEGIHWVICGGETGPGARPLHPDWVRAVRDQCVAAGVAFWFKGWGEWLPIGQRDADGFKVSGYGVYKDQRGKWRRWEVDWYKEVAGQLDERKTTYLPESHLSREQFGREVLRVGKKQAGHLLDGQEWRQFPEVAA
jgi:protein gp37